MIEPKRKGSMTDRECSNYIAAASAIDKASSFGRFDVFLEHAGQLTRAQRRSLLEDLWSGCDGSIWRNRKRAVALLVEAGYIGDLPRPDGPLKLYRGVYAPAHARGLSWSTSLEVARYFVRPFGRGPNRGGFVYTVLAPPEAVLAGFADRDESEYVLNPSGLPPVRRVEIIRPECELL